MSTSNSVPDNYESIRVLSESSKRGDGRGVFWEELPTTSKLLNPAYSKDKRKLLAESL